MSQTLHHSLETLALAGVGLPHVICNALFSRYYLHLLMDLPLASPRQPSIPCPTSPYLQCACNSHRFLEQNGKLVKHVLAVLDFMRSTDVTLSTLLWAVSWGVEELNSNHKVIFEHTSLLISDELPQILNNLFKPPQRHQFQQSR